MKRTLWLFWESLTYFQYFDQILLAAYFILVYLKLPKMLKICKTYLDRIQSQAPTL